MVDSLEQLDIDKIIDEVSLQLKESPQLLENTITDSKQINGTVQNNTETTSNPELNININIINTNEPFIQYDALFNPNSEVSHSPSHYPHMKVPPLSLSTLKPDTSFLIKAQTFQKDEYLKVVDWKISNNDNYPQIEDKYNTITSLLNKAALNKLSSSIKNISLEKVPVYPNIGPLSTLDNLVESQFCYDKSKLDKISYHIVQLEDYLFRWRNIKGDGNCFYRAIIFSFLENIIMTHNVGLLKEIIIELNEKFNDTYRNIRYLPFIKKEIEKIDHKLTIQILVLLENSMDDSNGLFTPYEILVKSFLFCQKFDYCMIFYLRFLLFEFIKDNWNKVYSTGFSVKIGNLLPLDYETQYGDFLYDKFFEEDLLKMGTEAEKIVIYLTPLVLKCDLNVIIYDFDNEDEAVNPVAFPSFLENKPKIEVLYRKTHYDLLYRKAYYNGFAKDLCYFLNLKEKQRLVRPECLVPLRELKKKSLETQIRLGMKQEYDINALNSSMKDNSDINIQCSLCKAKYNHTQNILNICNNCLLNEIDSQLFGFYLQYLYQSKEAWINLKYSFNHLFDKLFKGQQCIIANHKISLASSAEMTGKSLNEIMANIKAKLCVSCFNSITSRTEIWYQMPCGCVFCTQKCFDDYFNLYLQSQVAITKETKNYSSILDWCICGYQFNNSDYIALYQFFDHSDNKNFKKTIKEMIMKKLQQYCLICLGNNDIKFFRLILKDAKIAGILKIKEFEHIICQHCLQKNENNSFIDCLLCNSQHQVVKVIPFESGEDEDDTCILF